MLWGGLSPPLTPERAAGTAPCHATPCHANTMPQGRTGKHHGCPLRVTEAAFCTPTALPRPPGLEESLGCAPPPVLWAPGRVLGFRLQSLKAELGAAGVSGEAVPDRCPAGIVSHQHQSTPQGPQNCLSTRAPPRDPKIVPVVRGLAGQDSPEHPPPHLASPAGATGSPRCPHKCVPAWPCAPKSGTQWLLGLGSVLWKGGGQA